MIPESPKPRGGIRIRFSSPDSGVGFEIGQVAAVARLALGDHVPAGADVDITLRFQRRGDASPLRPARMVNERSDYGWVDVTVSVAGAVTYAREYTVQELFAPTLTRIADAIDGSRSSWCFAINHPGDGMPVTLRSVAPRAAASRSPEPSSPLTLRTLEQTAGQADGAADEEEHVLLVLHMSDLLADIGAMRPAPPVERSIEVDPDRPRSVPFSIRKAVEPPPPMVDPARYGIDAADLSRVNVLLPADMLELIQTLPLSGQVEEGGFLAGQVYRAAAPGERHLVKISRVLPAEHTGASWIHFTFTSDSYQAMSRALASQADDRLVGWWHTHPHGISLEMGLSGTDVELHHSTFRQPWQVAGLINLRGRRRNLRFYTAREDDMEECPLWIPDERDGYRLASSDLGHR